MRLLTHSLYICLFCSFNLAAQELQPGWGNEKVENQTPTRSRVILNGLWQFAPDGTTAAPEAASREWGLKHVPGAWANNHWRMQLRESIHRPGEGDRWQDIEWKELASAWYRRDLTIPADWNGSAILLAFERVSTDATVFINSKEVGQIAWPFGKVDITEAVTPGETANLEVRVVATTDAEEVLNFMATADSQVFKEKAKLNTRGLIGEVFLERRPKGAFIDDVFVITSIRENEVTIRVEVDGVPEGTELSLTAEMLDEKGKVEKSFRKKAPAPAPNTPLEVSWDWADPRLWDLGEPHLYTLKLRVQGDGMDDTYAQRFGFREFWIEGRDFFLNGRKVNFRPINPADGDATGNVALTRNHVRRYLEKGYNIGELWPIDHFQRGSLHYRDIWQEMADEEGFALIGNLPRINNFVRNKKWQFIWNDEKKERYRKLVEKEIKRFRNHPSILWWVNSANYFGHHRDQDPRAIGRHIDGLHPGWVQGKNAGLESHAVIKDFDPTRPVATHQGGEVGDVYMPNTYFNFFPLQDREEWLSDYVLNGTMPYLPVEFGTPLHCSFMRGKTHFGANIRTEPLLSEYAAIYLGPEAYETEPEAYRNDIASTFKEDQLYGNWQNRRSMITAPSFQAIQDLFIRNTWRSWRTWGISGGMIPWANGQGWAATDQSHQPTPSAEPFTPGHRGTHLPAEIAIKRHLFDAPGWERLLAADTMEEVNGPTLAWIAGSPEAFTEKNHSYRAGQEVSKQAVLLNDLNEDADYAMQWEAFVDGKSVATGEAQGRVATAEKVKLPISFTLPEALAAKTDGEIRLQARIGDREHEDTFAFRTFPNPGPLTVQASLDDPTGKTKAMLEAIGVQLESMPLGEAPLHLIGREALGTDQPLSDEVKAFAEKGGTVLVMIQDRDWYGKVPGLRLAEHLSRRAFPLTPEDPAIANLDTTDLRDWSAESTLVEAYPDYTAKDITQGKHRIPYWGWRWGSRGTVSSAMLEKPHHSAWTPLVEGEFDLAYSPLLELPVGEGRILLSTFDLEDQAPDTSAAAQLARQLLTRSQGPVEQEPTPLSTWDSLWANLGWEKAAPPSPAPKQPAPKLAPRQTVAYLGSEAGAKLLASMGAAFEQVDALPAKPQLLVVEDLAQVNHAKLQDYAAKGGHVLVLRQEKSSPGFTVTEKEKVGQFQLPPAWPEARGLSSSELRTRVDVTAPLIQEQEGLEVASGGWLAREPVGEGVIVYSQLDPRALPADEQTYHRYTRWRHTRALAQLLGNLGGQFKSDSRLFGRSQDSSPYHLDYIDDFERGDDPYRYFRW